jgi:flagellar hook-associated protein 2
MDFSSVTRISGMSSGLDTDSLVKKLMTAESAQYNKMKQQQQKLTWQSDSYRQWNSDIFTFQKSLFDMTLSSPYGTFAGSSSSDATVSGIATGGAIPGTHTFQVNSLADAATITGTPTVGTSDQLVTDDSTQTFQVTLADGRSQTINIGKGKDANSINDLVSKINSLTDTSGKSMGLQAIYDSTLNKFMIRTKDSGAATGLTINTDPTNGIMGKLGISNTPANTKLISGLVEGTSTNITITDKSGNKTTIDMSSKDKIADLVKKINQASFGTNSSLQATYNSTTNKLMVSNSDGSSLTVSTDSSSVSVTDNTVPYFAVGKDAKVIMDNASNNVSIASNTAQIYGVNYTFKSTTATPTTVSTTRDLDAEVKNIKDFISKYNDMNDKIYNALNEPVYKDYQPLTDDQRTAMSETQITQWETKAKSGLLHNDSILSTLYNSARSATSAVVNTGSQYNSLASIGVASSSYVDHGKLTVDDTKLRAALEADPDGVKALFTQDNTDQTKKGIIYQLRDSFQQAFTDTTAKAGKPGNSQNDQSTIGKSLQDVATRILNEQNRLTNVENSYYSKFTAMETAMSKYNSQSSWVSQQLGSSSQG